MSSPTVVKITPIQLFVMMILFQIGSAIVVGIGGEAKQDAWIAVLVASGIGIVIFFLYWFILAPNHGKTLFEIFELTIGRKGANVLTFMFVLYFFYLSTRVARDFFEILVTSTFPRTPIEIFAITFFLMVCYVVYLGPEVMVRTAEIFTPYFILFLVLLSLFLLMAEQIKIEKVRPVLGDGYWPVIDAVFPNLIGFPFGEIIALFIFMTYTMKKKIIPKVVVSSIIVTGLVLSFFMFIKVSVLGVDMNERTAFPLLSVTREVTIFNFIERLDPLVVFLMMIGIYVKVSVFFFSGVKGLEYIFSIPYRSFVIPIGLLLALFSILIASNFAEHIEEGIQFVPLFLHMPMQVGIPLIVAMILWWKRRKGAAQQNVKA
ncbi:GerAB/ArcD/ProY family transporter [Bacillus alkalicellulosilyticus]|uniref:GerAB/ArcD/ProY family transporter n=1 Tax=Alkalihalobacterium alkalicellulosilyticum TaxID=1912214 RepID=UPI0014820F8E|nr:endospore germination permease [Bacillus alkalicellulosilyticus]